MNDTSTRHEKTQGLSDKKCLRAPCVQPVIAKTESCKEHAQSLTGFWVSLTLSTPLAVVAAFGLTDGSSPQPITPATNKDNTDIKTRKRNFMEKTFLSAITGPDPGFVPQCRP